MRTHFLPAVREKLKNISKVGVRLMTFVGQSWSLRQWISSDLNSHMPYHPRKYTFRGISSGKPRKPREIVERRKSCVSYKPNNIFVQPHEAMLLCFRATSP